MIVLPGGRYAVDSLRDLPALIEALWLVRTRLSSVVGAASVGDWARVQRTSQRASTRLMSILDMRMDISGTEHIDPDEQYVVVALHESFLDVIALLQLPLELAWVARDELMGTPGLHAALASNLAITISPEQPRSALRRLLESAPSVFAQGRSLVMFPQGTLVGIEAAFARGAFRIAERFDRPVLPVVIAGTHDVYDYPFSPVVQCGRPVRMEVLKPVPSRMIAIEGPAIEERMRSNALANHPKPRTYVPERDGFWDDYAFEIADQFPELRGLVAAHRSMRGAAQSKGG